MIKQILLVVKNGNFETYVYMISIYFSESSNKQEPKLKKEIEHRGAGDRYAKMQMKA